MNGGSDNIGDDKVPSGKGPPGDRPQRDLWDYIAILGRPLSALLTALAVGAIGWFGNNAVADREAALTERTLLEQKSRLYTQLLSQREQADSALRKDMFKEILSRFFGVPGATDTSGDMSKSLLKLEMLALNFGESLSLSPLFRELDREIRSNTSGTWRGIKSTANRKRLHSLAKRVSDSQVATLGVGGKIFDFGVPTNRVESNTGEFFPWPDPWAEFSDEEIDEKIRAEETPEDRWHEMELGGITRSYQFSFSDALPEDKTVKVKIRIFEIPTTAASDDKQHVAFSTDEKDVTFELSYFDFPLIDNVRLSNDQRFALVLKNFDRNLIQLTGVTFPGVYASQRDKPFLDDVVEDAQPRKSQP